MPRRPPPDPRREALAILRRVGEAGAFAGILLEEREGRFDDPRDGALLHELVLGVLRRRASLDHAIARASSRELASVDPEVLDALRIGAYALFHLDRVPDFAAVDTAVDLVKRSRPAAAAFANGVLRAIARAGAEALPPEPAEGDVDGLALWGSHPVWWVARLVERVGFPRAKAIVEADNRPAPTVLRARRGTRDALALRLAAEGVRVEPGAAAPDALVVRAGGATRTRCFRNGEFWIQDEASQLVPELLQARDGDRVADLCAAPGGKTLGLAEAAGSRGLVVAADRHAGRLRRLARNVARTGFANVVAVAADVTRPAPFRVLFDGVLVDAPCSGTGTLRRHPEIRWRLSPGDLPTLAARQRAILASGAALVREGGALVYAVCSMEPEEGEETPRALVAERPDFRLETEWRTDPAEAGTDGFYAARLRRIQSAS